MALKKTNDEWEDFAANRYSEKSKKSYAMVSKILEECLKLRLQDHTSVHEHCPTFA